jgi:hypothetical protein
MPWHGAVLPFSLQQRVTEIFGTNNSNNNNNNAFLWQQKDLFYQDVDIKDESARKRKRARWRKMGFSLELTSKLPALMMIRPAMEMGSLNWLAISSAAYSM